MFYKFHQGRHKWKDGIPFDKFGFFGSPFAGGLRRPKFNVPLNVAETETEYQVKVYATGFSKEQITITVVDDMLYISGSKELDEKDEPSFVLQEFPVKNFERTLALNGRVDTESISARSENEVLIITLPKAKATLNKGQTIEVN